MSNPQIEPAFQVTVEGTVESRFFYFWRRKRPFVRRFLVRAATYAIVEDITHRSILPIFGAYSNIGCFSIEAIELRRPGLKTGYRTGLVQQKNRESITS